MVNFLKPEVHLSDGKFVRLCNDDYTSGLMLPSDHAIWQRSVIFRSRKERNFEYMHGYKELITVV
jgi:hypothetical protein